MTFLAISAGVVVLIGIAILLLTLRTLAGTVESLASQVRILIVSVNGLEAAILAEVRMTRESADAAAALSQGVVDAVRETAQGPAVESHGEKDARMAAFGRITRARDLFAGLEADSYQAALMQREAANG